METYLITGLLIIIISQLIHLNRKVNKMPTAEETLDAFVAELNTAKDAIIARIDALIQGSGDLTADEVTAKLTSLRDDLVNIGNPPSPDA